RVPGVLLLHTDHPRRLHSFPTRRSSDLSSIRRSISTRVPANVSVFNALRSCCSSSGVSCVISTTINRTPVFVPSFANPSRTRARSEEHTSELQSRENLVCRLLLEKKKR